MSNFKVFIVEDDPWYGELLKYHLALNSELEVTLFASATECLNNLYQRPDVVTIDFNLPDMSGKVLLQRIQAHNDQLPVIVISGQEEIRVALNFIKEGVIDYLLKDDNTHDLLWKSINRIRETHSLKAKVEALRTQLEDKFDFEKTIIGQSGAIKRTFGLIEKAITTNINVSINGETGTGKEVVAKAIHYNSERKKKNFVAVNMAAIPKELIESELFGHERGSFTGAVNRKIGKFEEANGGTIFLDEIAELDLNLQSKLLRVLQEREVTRIGGHETIKFDARLIVATHKNLNDEVKKGLFREDLYYRIIGLPIELPPLRNRGNDILILAKHFISEFANDNKIKAPNLSADAKELLLKYHYPGNVRELKSIIDLACVMQSNDEIQTTDITFTATKPEELFSSVEKTMKEYTADIISYYLKKYNNNVLIAAARLDIGKSTIYNMIKSGEIKQLQ
jgi:two-component system response regulator AtoC